MFISSGVLTGRCMRRARGFSTWGLLSNLLIMGVLLLAAVRVAPNYIQYLTIKDIVARTASEFNSGSQSVADLKLRLAKQFNSNQIYDVSAENIAVYRERGVVVIDANYEKRFALFWILDGVLKFEDLKVETAPTGRP